VFALPILSEKTNRTPDWHLGSSRTWLLKACVCVCKSTCSDTELPTEHLLARLEAVSTSNMKMVYTDCILQSDTATAAFWSRATSHCSLNLSGTGFHRSKLCHSYHQIKVSNHWRKLKTMDVTDSNFWHQEMSLLTKLSKRHYVWWRVSHSQSIIHCFLTVNSQNVVD